MHFTREPIIETIITPKEGYKLVVRSSKGPGHEEFFVDSLQVVLIGQNCFYRSLEKPKAFFVPAGDYEVMEVRETRVALKMPSKEGAKEGIKIAGGRETSLRSAKETKEPLDIQQEEKPPSREAAEPIEAGRIEKRKRRFRKRQKDEALPETGGPITTEMTSMVEERPFIIPPPETLISQTISRYREIPDFAGAFYEKKQGDNGNGEDRLDSSDERLEDAASRERQMHQMQQAAEEDQEEPIVPLEDSLEEEEGREFLSS